MAAGNQRIGVSAEVGKYDVAVDVGKEYVGFLPEFQQPGGVARQ